MTYRPPDNRGASVPGSSGPGAGRCTQLSVRRFRRRTERDQRRRHVQPAACPERLKRGTVAWRIHTDVSADDLDRFVAGFRHRRSRPARGIAHGTENSNFGCLPRLVRSSSRYTKSGVDPADLPFFLGLMRHLSEAGFPCPAPIPDRDGEFLHRLSDRPAAVVAFASGDQPREIT